MRKNVYFFVTTRGQQDIAENQLFPLSKQVSSHAATMVSENKLLKNNF